MSRIARLLDRRFPHDTLYIGGRPYMHRWYVIGYAPPVTCPNCGGDRSDPNDPGWQFYGHTEPGSRGPCPLCNGEGTVARPGWRWQNHGIGAVRIHCIVASDDSRAFHDHPWPFAAIGLAGSYVEETPFIGNDGTVPLPGQATNWRRRFRAPFINIKRATDLHVLTVDPGPVWTLFLTRPKQRSWGFGGPFGWLGWRTFDAEFPERNAWTEAGIRG